MEGNARENLTFTQNVKKRGYETVIPLRFNGSFLVANALAADGTVLATTDVWDLALGATVSICSLFLPLRYLICDVCCRDCSTNRSSCSLKHEAGAVGYCKIGCGHLDDFDHIIVLLTAFSAVLLVAMWVARKRTL